MHREFPRVVEHVYISKAVARIYIHILDTRWHFNFSTVLRVQLIPAKPYGKNLCVGLLYKIRIWYIIVMRVTFLVNDSKVDGHLHSALALKCNFILILSGALHRLNSVINFLICLNPLIKKPVEVGMSKVNDGVAEIFRIRMTEFPLVKIIFHGSEE